MSIKQLEVKCLATASEAGQFTGVASPFDGKADRQGDIVLKGAFVKSLAERETEAQPVAMLWSHDPAQPIGKWLSIQESAQGLEVTGQLNLETTKGAEAYSLLKDGQLSLSIGYRIKASNPTAQGNELTEVDLFEISLVAIPANAGAKITGYKAFDVHAPDGKKNLERAMRDVLPLSRKEVKRLLSEGFRGIQCDAEPALSDHQTALIIDRLKQNTDLLRK